MKFMRRSSESFPKSHISYRSIEAAEGIVEPGKTRFYKLTLDELLDILRENGCNIITIWQLEEQGFSALDFKHSLWGCGVVDDFLYICDTDGKDILINGKQVDPEEVVNLLADGDIDESAFSDYIVEPDEKYIRRWVDPDAMVQPDFEEAALALLQQPYKYTLQQIAKAADDYEAFEL